MAMAFNEPLKTPPTATATAADTSVTQTPAAGSAAVTPGDDTEVLDYEAALKNDFGWESTEQALAEITELRALKEKPQTPEIAWADDQSKQIHELIRQGKRKEVREFLETQERLEAFTTGDVTKDNAPEIIKLGMKLGNKLLTDDEIHFQYKQDYGVPKEPVQKAIEEDDDFAERHQEWKDRVAAIEMKKIVAAKMAVPQLQSLKSKIELPEIISPKDDRQKEFEAIEASNAQALEAYNKVIAPAINSLKESDLKFTVKVDDPNNKMQFEVSVAPESDDFNLVKQESLDTFGWLNKIAFDEKGNFLPQRLNRAILLEKNFDKFAQSIARQAVNAERARLVAANSNQKGNGMRDFNVTPQEKSELASQMERAMSV
jgi:hypothetical protein